MKNRDEIKWKPFNSVVPASYLLKNDESVVRPNLSTDEINEYEEILKKSLYLSSPITIKYIENNKIMEITDYVIKLDPLKKNIYLSQKTINFRQIYHIK